MIPPHTRSSFPFPLLPHPWRRFSREVQMLESPGSCCWTFQNSVKFVIPPGKSLPALSCTSSAIPWIWDFITAPINQPRCLSS